MAVKASVVALTNCSISRNHTISSPSEAKPETMTTIQIPRLKPRAIPKPRAILKLRASSICPAALAAGSASGTICPAALAAGPPRAINNAITPTITFNVAANRNERWMPIAGIRIRPLSNVPVIAPSVLIAYSKLMPVPLAWPGTETAASAAARDAHHRGGNRENRERAHEARHREHAERIW